MKITVKVAINEFGHIGCLAFRQMFRTEGCEVVAVSDLTSPRMLARLLEYDSTQGTYAKAGTVVVGENSITVDGKEITIYTEVDAKNLSWRKLDVDVVLECTGFYASKDKVSACIETGARKVVISAPAGNDLPIVAFDTNHDILRLEDTVVPAASCATNYLAPMAKALNDLAPIQNGITSTIHAYTDDQMTLDGLQRKDDLRRSCAVVANTIPNSAGATEAIGLVIPELRGKPIGSARCISTPTGPTTTLITVVKGKITVDGINATIKAVSDESFGYITSETVSGGAIDMCYGSLFDATQIMAMGVEDGNTQMQVVSWYGSESSCISRMVRTIRFFSRSA